MAIFLVRHAHAGTLRGGLDDVERPLTPTGRSQAEAIAARLATTTVVSVLASPARRCVETVELVARARGIAVTTTGKLFEGTDAELVLALLDGAHAAHGGDVVACSHGDVIPDVLRARSLDGLRIDGERACEKGSIWEVTVDSDGAWQRACYHPPGSSATGA